MKKRNPITRERGRVARALERAIQEKRQCDFWLHIIDGPSHAGIQDDLFEDIGRAYARISSFTVAELTGEMPCVRSEATCRIMPEEAAIIDGELRDPASLEQPKAVESEESHLWHFAGGIWFSKHETCFCEYDADQRKGGMIVFVDGASIPGLLTYYPDLKDKIRIAKPGMYDQLLKNW